MHCFFFNDTATTEIYTLSLHDALPIYSTPPPPIESGSEYSQDGDARYAMLPPEVRPQTECLADVVVRMLPYWYDAIVPDLRAGLTVLVAAHGNSLRADRKSVV